MQYGVLKLKLGTRQRVAERQWKGKEHPAVTFSSQQGIQEKPYKSSRGEGQVKWDPRQATAHWA